MYAACFPKTIRLTRFQHNAALLNSEPVSNTVYDDSVLLHIHTKEQKLPAWRWAYGVSGSAFRCVQIGETAGSILVATPMLKVLARDV